MSGLRTNSPDRVDRKYQHTMDRDLSGRREAARLSVGNRKTVSDEGGDSTGATIEMSAGGLGCNGAALGGGFGGGTRAGVLRR